MDKVAGTSKALQQSANSEGHRDVYGGAVDWEISTLEDFYRCVMGGRFSSRTEDPHAYYKDICTPVKNKKRKQAADTRDSVNTIRRATGRETGRNGEGT
jgi:hypothetical protein